MKRLIRYFSGRSVIKDISAYGYDFSMKKYILAITTGLLVIFGISMIYGLKPVCVIITGLVSISVIPGIIRKRYYNNNRLKKFMDVDIYLHQMAYSFMRNPKIYTALEDTGKIAGGTLGRVIEQAMDELEYGMGEDVYANALYIIEKEYNCSRIRTLHKFIIGIEKRGGRYKNALRVLLDDSDRWIKGIYRQELEIKNVKRDTTIGVIISIVLSGLTIFMSAMLNRYKSGQGNIVDDWLYQGTAVIFLVLCILFYAFTNKHYGYEILNDKDIDTNSRKYYKLVFKTNVWNIIEKIIPVITVLGILAGLAFINGFYFIFVYLVMAMAVMVIYPLINKKSAMKKLTNNLRQAFSDWLRNVALNLENMPLIAAIEDTYDESTYIIKNSLDTFIRDIEADPSDIKPYYEFLSEYGQTDIMSTVRTLYSVSELPDNQVDETINSLIQRNNELINKQSEIAYKDRISLFKFMEYIPVFLMALKMSVDMMLVITLYL